MDWGNRVLHETQSYNDNAFVTLTYSDEHLPENGSLQLRDLQLFWKRIRKAGHTIRYFACGEYGDQTHRPHYHAVVFGYWPNDRVRIPHPGRTVPLYRSEQLDKLWGQGNATFSPVTRENATYVAKYTLNKYDDKGAKRNFEGRQEPFLIMSRKPGLGNNYAREHARALTRFDGIRLRGGQLAKLPKYYDNVIEKHEPQLVKGLKTRRSLKAKANPDNTGTRLVAREAVKQSQMAILTRNAN